MTTLVCWCGVDSRAPSALYVASDSRITWGNADAPWDGGRKIFRFAGRSDVLAFAGDVVFAVNVLSRLVVLVDSGAIDLPAESERRFEVIKAYIENAIAKWPNGRELSSGVSIVYATRTGEGMGLVFNAFGLSWAKGKGWRAEQFKTPVSESGLICAYGSGAVNVRDAVEAWMKEDVSGRTSRSVFSGFCDSIESGNDPLSGGPPQLVGMYRRGVAEDIGVIWQGKRFLAGVECDLPPLNKTLQWRNRLFERCDARSLQPLDGAQRHARPKRLGPNG